MPKRHFSGSPPERPPPAVLYVGLGELAEFRPIVERLARDAALKRARDGAEAEALLQAHAADLVVVEEPRPREPETIERLWRSSPLSAFWAVTSSWAEGEARTGRPSRLARQIVWHEFEPTWAIERDRLRRGEAPSWQAPLTVTHEERILANARSRDERAEFVDSVAIYSNCRGQAELLADLCRALGATTVSSRLDAPAVARGVGLAIVDLDPLSKQSRESWRRIVAATPDTPRVVLLGFPRWQDVEHFKATGASAIYAKPLSLWALAAMVSPRC